MFMTEIETKDINLAMEAAGHDFTVEKHPIKTDNGIEIPDHMAVIDINNDKYLGTVGKTWEPVQPSEIYSLAEELIESTDGTITGGFNMLGGSILGIQFNLAQREYVSGDVNNLNFVMLSSFNGMYGISGSAIIDRLACLNQCNASSKFYNLRHTKNVRNRMSVVKEMLKFYKKEIESFDEKMMKMVGKRMNEQDAVNWFKSLFPKPKSPRAERKLDNQVLIFIDCLRSGRGSEISGVKGTSYGAFQALTEYINHYRSTRIHNGRDEDEVRYQTIHFGSGNTLTQKGLNTLSEMDMEFDESDFLID